MTEITAAIEKCETNIKENEKKITAERALEENGREREARQLKLTELQTEIEEYTNQVVRYETERMEKTSAIKIAEDKKQQATERRDANNQNLLNEKNRLRDLEKAKADRLTVFHAKMPHVMREIQSQKNRFHELPVGPMGLSVKLLKEDWADICENLFGKALNGLLVTDHHDREVLQEILKKHKWYYLCDHSP